MRVKLLGNDTKEEVEKRLQVVTSAGLLSRTEGTVTDVLESHTDYENNLKLAKRIIGYGHKSITEHDYLVFAIEDVTPIVEQVLIGNRLTSFTIKSRRNVDFRTSGYHTPDFKDNDGNILENNEKLKEIYNGYMDILFNKYSNLVDEGLPIEDCRYILPYSFHSNIIMGCDANELFKITCELLYGKSSKITELHELGLKFEKIIKEYVPFLSESLDKEKDKECYKDNLSFLDEKVKKSCIYNEELLTGAKLINYTEDGDFKILCNAIMSRYQLDYEDAQSILYELMRKDENIKEEIMKAILKNRKNRELEHIIYSFQMPISLANLTHITRHRMHSLMVPDFVPLWNFSNYIKPDSIKENYSEYYDDIYRKNKEVLEFFKKQGVRDEDLVYFYLSGNACNINTTMNARTFKHISSLRCCNKAQWEIRSLANQMKEEVSKVTPLVAKGFGAKCITEGYCPEGKDSCKNRGVVIKKKVKSN